MLIVKNEHPQCLWTSGASSSKTSLFLSRLITRQRLAPSSAGTQTEKGDTADSWVFFFFLLLRNHWIKQNQSVRERSHIYHRMTETYATEGGIVHIEPIIICHIRHEVWKYSFRSGEKKKKKNHRPALFKRKKIKITSKESWPTTVCESRRRINTSEAADVNEKPKIVATKALCVNRLFIL